jgi:16S rRNA (cytosine1402-N4)-methyltransferase
VTEQLLAEEIHTSVLLEECMHFLAPGPKKVFVDGTLGLGGHSAALLARSGPDGRVIAFDWDENALARSARRLVAFADRLTIVRRNFAEFAETLAELGVDEVDGILLDVGLSSLQLDHGGRGFSFRQDELLDMRMDNRRKVTAQSLLACCREEELADIFYYYGDERQARPIARAIVEHRVKESLRTTGQLVDVVFRAIPKRFHPKKIHVATKVFQALRIAVNSELENLAGAVDAGVRCLKPGGIFCVISFHSLEDRVVKRKFRENQLLEVLTSRPVTPSPQEVAANPRSRSARLRVARKKILLEGERG